MSVKILSHLRNPRWLVFIMVTRPVRWVEAKCIHQNSLLLWQVTGSHTKPTKGFIYLFTWEDPKESQSQRKCGGIPGLKKPEACAPSDCLGFWVCFHSGLLLSAWDQLSPSGGQHGHLQLWPRGRGEEGGEHCVTGCRRGCARADSRALLPTVCHVTATHSENSFEDLSVPDAVLDPGNRICSTSSRYRSFSVHLLMPRGVATTSWKCSWFHSRSKGDRCRQVPSLLSLTGQKNNKSKPATTWCLPANEKVNKIWYIHTIKQYLATKRKEVLMLPHE